MDVKPLAPYDPINGKRTARSREKCQGEITESGNRNWRQRQGLDFRCTRDALFDVNGDKLCALHAGRKLLEAALRDQPWAAAPSLTPQAEE
jgi:hypothetical protein